MSAVVKLLENGLRDARLPSAAERRRAIAKFLDENGQLALQAREEAQAYAAEARQRSAQIKGIGERVDEMPLAADGKRHFVEDFPVQTREHRERLSALIAEVKERVEALAGIKHMWASPWHAAYSTWLDALQEELDTYVATIRALRMAWARQISRDVRAKLSGTYTGDSTSLLRDLREAP
jgi:flagellar biosynthesis/type III secretory pathway protein FliH